MDRQYKKMQAELKNQVASLEKKLAEVSLKLGYTRIFWLMAEYTDNSFAQTKATLGNSVSEKDSVIDEQNQKILHLGRDFDRMLNVTPNLRHITALGHD